MSAPESPDQWLFDFILLFLKSPVFTVPLVDFIDQHCLLFDGEDENKLCYTDIHNQFRTLLDKLISSNLAQLGVTPEQFVEACARGKDQDVNKAVFEQILAVDDFLTFKKMMCKRNMALEVEALEALQHQQTMSAVSSATASVAAPVPMTEQDECAQLEAALKASVTEQQRADTVAAAREHARRQLEATSASPPSPASDDDVQAALAASMIDSELQAARDRLDLADLEAAIALSLQLEQQRLERHMEAQLAEALQKEQARLDAEDAAAAAAAAAAAVQSIAPPNDEEKYAYDDGVASAPAAPAASSLAPPATTATATTTTTAAKPSTLPKLLADLPAIRPKAAIPHATLLQLSDQFEAEREALEQRAAQEFKTNAAALKQSQPRLTDAERAQRQEFLRAQRDKLLQQKKVQREKEEGFMEAERKRIEAERNALIEAKARAALENFRAPAAAAAASAATASAASAAAVVVPAPPAGKRDDTAERQSMRQALAQRFKDDMLQKQAAASSSALDEQIARAERLRAEAAEREATEKVAAIERAAAAEDERKRRLAAMHASMQVNKIDAAQSDFF